MSAKSLQLLMHCARFLLSISVLFWAVSPVNANGDEAKVGRAGESYSILVTGCAGFIGSNFVSYFHAKYPDVTIVGIDDLSSGSKNKLEPWLVFYKKSILDKGVLEQLFSKHKPRYVFHFAALPRVQHTTQHPTLTSNVNVVGTVALLEASKNHGVKRFIFSSSSAVYGDAKKLPTDEAAPIEPLNLYAAQKYSGEIFCRLFSKLFGLDTVSLRYFNVFGPKDYGDSPHSTVITAWLASMYLPNNKTPFIEGDGGSNSRDFCYVDNIIEANILAMDSKRDFNGDVFNVACQGRTTIKEVRDLIEKHTGKSLALEARPGRLGDARHTYADISKARKLLGYKPTVNFLEGLKRTISWFEAQRMDLGLKPAIN